MKSGYGGQVLLIGGSSGTGKSILARRFSQLWGIPCLQVDDFRLVLQRVVVLSRNTGKTASTIWGQLGLQGLQELIGLYSASHAEPERRVEALKANAKAMSSALEIVIAHHIATKTPVIIEGDGLVPSLLNRSPIANLIPEPGQFHGLFLVEDDEERLMRTALQRDRGFSDTSFAEQKQIVRASWLFGQWLKQEAMRNSIPVVSPFPFDTLVRRVIQVIK